MEIILKGLTRQICLLYIDDIIVFSKIFPEHLTSLRMVFDRLREANIKLKPSKCNFGRKKVHFLGYIIGKEGVLPDPDKIKVVKEFPVPRNVKELKSFLGLAQYYKRFVLNYSQIAAVINQLTSKKNKLFIWTPDCQKAFETLKDALTKPPVFAYPDFNETFQLQVDASSENIGYVLAQEQNGKEVVITYSGRTLSLAERIYSTTEKEALAMIEGIKHFQTYLYGRKFEILTDHNPLKWLMQIKEPTGRLA